MEQSKDYTGNQTDIIARILKKILKKLLSIKWADNDDTQSIFQDGIADGTEILTLQTLQKTDDNQLLATLIEHGYDCNNIKLLADILYKIYPPGTGNDIFKNKALILYEYYLSQTATIDLQVYNLVSDMKKS